MILAFSGDAFLVQRAARSALRERGIGLSNVTERGEDLDPQEIPQLAGQAGLFGPVALLLDFDAAFTGQAGVKPRNETLKALEAFAGDDASLVVIQDGSATEARQRRYQELGEHHHLPTPRFGRLVTWTRDELKAAGVRFAKGVPAELADLFGEDLPALAAEIRKLAVLDEELDETRVRFLVHRPAARDAFDLIEAAVEGRPAAAWEVARALLSAGEPPQRVFGALAWQFEVVARAVAWLEDGGRPDPRSAAREMKVAPFAAKKALAIAERLDEAGLRRALECLVEAEVRAKGGRDPGWALESATLELASLFQGRAARPAR